MRRPGRLIIIAVCAVLLSYWHPPARGAEDAEQRGTENRALREYARGLEERVRELEQEGRRLQAENAKLQEEIRRLKAEAARRTPRRLPAPPQAPAPGPRFPERWLPQVPDQRIPEGWIEREFNGLKYYLIPLKSRAAGGTAE